MPCPLERRLRTPLTAQEWFWPNSLHAVPTSVSPDEGGWSESLRWLSQWAVSFCHLEATFPKMWCPPPAECSDAHWTGPVLQESSSAPVFWTVMPGAWRGTVFIQGPEHSVGPISPGTRGFWFWIISFLQIFTLFLELLLVECCACWIGPPNILIFHSSFSSVFPRILFSERFHHLCLSSLLMVF